jgi:hypothetical protein
MADRLGLGCNDRDQLFPVHVKVLSNVVMAAAGRRHSLVANAAGKLYAFYDEPGFMVPRQVESMRSTTVVAIAAGWCMSVVVSDDGELSALMFGGELGELGELMKAPPPRTLRDRRVASVCAGENHALLMLEGGEVLAFGSGDYGKLGIGDDEEEPRLTPCWLPTINKAGEALQ